MGSVARSGAGSKDPSRLIQEVEAIIASAVGCFLLVCLLSYVPESPDVNHGGRLGFTLANILTQGFGYGAYVFPSALVAAGASLFLSHRMRLTPVRWVGAIFLLLLVSVTLGVYRPHVDPQAAGGMVGGFLSTLMLQGLGRGGSVVVLISLFLLDFMMITGHALSELLRRLAAAIDEAWEKARQAAVDSFRSALARVRGGLPSIARVSVPLPGFLSRKTAAESAEPRIVRRAAIEQDEDGEEESPLARRSSPLIEVLRPRGRDKAAKGRAEVRQAEFSFGGPAGNFRLPPANLLGKHDDRNDYVDEKALVDSSAILEQKLATFGVGGRVTAVRPGPVITTFEFEPEAGVKVSRVVNLCDDLTMALRAHGVRIVAPIPGKNCVGIEVSNKNRAVVTLRDLIDTNEFRDHKSILALALGRDTTGLPVFADLAKMPHLLMAGATGTGKSVALNTYILSILYKATPNDVRFIMIDPKMLELSLYEGIPHLLVPVVTDVKKASAALANVLREMDRRFELMKDKKVRSLDDYNRRIAEEKIAAEAEAAAEAVRAKAKGKVEVVEEVDDDEEEGAEEAVAFTPPALRHEHLPRILVIIDELADLMMTVGREVETHITRLAQKARAAGIHLIVATQRPSVDVITGLIKANFPSRISCQVTSRPDSRTILDTVGADRLLGNGDALYMAPGTSHLQRLHGGLIGDGEIKEIVDFLKLQGEPDYRMDILEGGGDGEDGDDEGEEAYDELYDRAVALVTQHGQGSTSWVQRKLGIGYNRSARIMEMMEREGVVGPADGAKPRKVLVSAL